MLPKKSSLAIVTFGVLILLLELTKFAHPFAVAAALDFRPRPSAIPEEPARPRPGASYRNKIAIIQNSIEPNLIDQHESLKAFYQSLWRTEAQESGAVTRVLHYGDSPVTADSITADVRALLQEHFGDAGHGFILIAKPWAWYGHRGVDVRGSGWHIEAASQSHARDGFHGVGGVSFEGSTGASSQLVLHEDHARMEIKYLRQPGGGTLAVEADSSPIGKLETDGPEKQPAFKTFDLPSGARDIALVVEHGPVRMFGVSFEKDGPGVIYNSLGLNGGQVYMVVRFFEKAQWAAELEHERPDLVVVNYGTNESLYADYIQRYYPGELREVIRRIKTAVPKASLLVMSPMDRGERNSLGQIVTPAALPRLVEIQRQIAAEMSCAFFNTFQAMGGEGTMARWYENQPRLVSADFTHPLPAGAKKVGVLLDQALESGFRQFKAREEQRLAEHSPAKGTEQ
ncbi:MAG TPA: GDSL-type esterase/lipase family protein [Bryobacteraceae bacterium]|jgi:lysophospholipase L1-like esterase|nr:GDSL-type esterase/lipase family protein [Bryobacteraceae bacterium]